MKLQKIILIILVLFFISLIIFFFIHSRKKELGNVSIIENEDYYNIKANYPVVDNTEFSDKIKKTIDNKISDFKDDIKDLDKNIKYDFNAESSVIDNDKNLYSIHIIIYEYTGGAHYMREDLMYYYDYQKSKELYWDDIFIDDNKTLEILSALTKEKLLLEHKDYLYNEKELSDGIKPIKENFQYITLNKDYITVIFPPYQVAPWSTGEIDIDLDYNKINDILYKPFKKEIPKIVDKKNKS